MKRKMLLPLLMTLAILALPAAAQASVTETWTPLYTVEPTCTEQGYTVYENFLMPGTLDYRDFVPALGHDWGEWEPSAVAAPPTCTKSGVLMRACSRCGLTESTSSSALGHDWDDWRPLPGSSPATCTEAGMEGRYCSRCGEWDSRMGSALGHDWGEWRPSPAAMPPTCTESGTEFRYCSRCGTAESRVSPALGHDPVTAPGYPPSCEQEGRTDGVKCSRCGEILSGCDPIPAVGHDWSKSEITKQAACEEEGEITYYCYRPQTHAHTKKETIPALGHDWSQWIIDAQATCTSNGKQHRACSRCGKEEHAPVPALGHQPTAAPETAPTCTEVGWKGGEMCARCGETLSAHQIQIPALGHDWGEWRVLPAPAVTSPAVEERSCSRCGAAQQREIGTPVLTGIVEERVFRPGEKAFISLRVENVSAKDTIQGIRFEWYPADESGEFTSEPLVINRPEVTLAPGKSYTLENRYYFGVDQEEALKGVIDLNFHAWCHSAVYNRDYDCVWNGVLHMEPDAEEIPYSGAAFDPGTYTQFVKTPQGTWQRYVDIDVAGHYGEYTSTAVQRLSGMVRDDCLPDGLGHAWDEGVMTKEATVLFEGEKTFTCTRCGATRTEAVPALIMNAEGGVAFTLVNLPVDGEESDLPLTIVTQPQPGAVFRNEPSSHYMYIEAAGGMPPYRYQWYGASLSRKRVRIGFRYEKSSSARRFFAMQYGDEPSFDADRGNYEYYCKVTDAAGNKAISNHVVVKYRPYFLEQPQDVNYRYSYNSYHMMSVVVEDGTEPYTYQWYRIYDDGKAVPQEGETKPDYVFLPPKGSNLGDTYGRFFCEVTDAEGYTARSRTARVYKSDPLSCDGPCDTVLGDDKTATLAADITGGVPPFEIKWYDWRGAEIFSGTSEAWRAEIKVSEYGEYTFVVKDELADTYTAKANVNMKPLTIVKQPQDGRATYGNPVTLSIVVSDGVPPYTYVLSKDGGAEKTETSQYPYCDFTVTEAGLYDIYVDDANGRYAVSRDAKVSDDAFYIKDYTSMGHIRTPNGIVRLSVTAEGGTTPYTYKWEKWDTGAKQYKVLKNTEKSMIADELGSYRCTVTDKAGRKAVAANITVDYIGSTPWITQNPQDIQLRYDEAHAPMITLTCDAFSSTGNSNNLKYTWEKKGDFGWKEVKSGKKISIVEMNEGELITGYYRCKVTDTSTKGYAYSREARVSMLLEGTGQFIGGRTILFKIRGGDAPYEVGGLSRFEHLDWPGELSTHERHYDTASANFPDYDVFYVATYPQYHHDTQYQVTIFEYIPEKVEKYSMTVYDAKGDGVKIWVTDPRYGK